MAASRPIRVGSRGSELALIQARSIMGALDQETELVIIETHGDRVTDRPLNELGGAGLFIKEIEAALFEERIDLAVHSMKDVPSVVPEGLILAATLERLDARDALVSRTADSIAALVPDARLATGSLRRRSQLLAMRPDLKVEDLRGNVGTRLAKFDTSSWDAIVLAAAGLVRLGLEERIRFKIPTDDMIPAVGQGALAIETRSGDRDVLAAVAELNHVETATAITCERAFLRRLEGGCQVPIGAFADIREDELRLLGYVGSVDGQRRLRREATATLPSGADAASETAGALGLSLAQEMLDAGAGDIVSEFASS